MAITKYPPNTIFLGGEMTEVGDVAASEAITPGMLIERFSSAGTPKFRKHSTAGGAAVPTFLRNSSMLNKGIDDAVAAGDTVEAFIGTAGCAVYAIIASGQNIAAGNFLESAGNGKLRVYAAGVRLAQALEDVNNTAGPSDARIRVEVL